MSTISEVIEQLKLGRPVVLSDDESRENEGDLIFPSQIVTPEVLSFMMNECRGLICMTITEEKRQELGLDLQVTHNESVFGTNFAVPFDHVDVQHIGVTAEGRAYSIKKVLDGSAKKEDLVVPGFVVPVVSRAGGVLKRRGQTEGSIDLVRLAGYLDSAIICEILDEKGEVLRGGGLEDFCKKNNFASCSIEQLVQFRKENEVNIRQIKESAFIQELPIRESLLTNNKLMQFEIKIFIDDVDNVQHFALTFGDFKKVVNEGRSIFTRIHSECLTGDVFGSLRCDCGFQLDESLRIISQEEAGLLIYLMQEGRGIGLANKIKAYSLQEQGLDTFEANEILGFDADLRDYRVATQILKILEVSKVNLITNNPQKIQHLKDSGIDVVTRISVEPKICKENEAYLRAKVEKMGHLISL